MYSKVLFSLVMLLSTLTVNGQDRTISGTVSDAMGMVEFATIEIAELKKGTTTDSAGRYTLTVPPGTYHVKASFVGLIPVQKTIKVKSDQAVYELDFQLVTNTQLEEVVISGSLKRQYVAESPVKIEVIRAEQLETFIPAASSSVVDGVSMINGVEEVVACGVCFTNSISINGLPGQYSAILMDGMPMYGNLASVYGLNGIPNVIVDRYEVIKGPSSTLYGSEAVAGVLNIITKDPKEQPLVTVDLMGTTHEEIFGNIAIAPRIGNTSGYIGVNYAFINGFQDHNGDGFGDNVNVDRLSLFTKWDIARKSGLPFSIAAKVYHEDRRNGVKGYLEDRNYRDLRGSNQVYGESILTQRVELFGSYTFAGIESLKLDFSMSAHSQDSYYGSDHYLADQQIAYTNLIWNRSLGNHDLTAGLTARFQSYDDNTVATEEIVDSGAVNVRENQFIPGVFIQDEWTLSPRWTLLPGIRLDHFQAHGLIPSPRLSAKFKASDWTTIRLNTGTGFRIVNLFTEDHAFITGQRQVEIRGDLQPERSVSVALSVNHIFTLGRTAGSFDLDAHYTHFSNKIIPDYDTPGKIIYANSPGSARTMGIAGTANLTFSIPLSLQAGLNVQRAVQTDIVNGEESIADIEFAPRFTGLFTLTYEVRKWDLTVGYTAQLTGPMALPVVYDLDENGYPLSEPRPTRSQTYSIHNIQITKALGRQWSIYAGVQNLFDTTQSYSPLTGFNDPNSNPGFSDFFDTAYAYGTMHGREFYVGVKFNTGGK